ncbi:MAG TPA: hypothetical protein PK971_07765 [Saprospiraceae bacterium]|nr:hypothetical protein [Saprospiraceae bacterium]HND88208.1 hypothetical protein [Saprospiraceae bacterium]HNG90895.1 hypothetical protein [Saprospiraceae bacterium]
MTRFMTLFSLSLWLGFGGTGLSAQSATFGIHVGATYGKYQPSQSSQSSNAALSADIGWLGGIDTYYPIAGAWSALLDAQYAVQGSQFNSLLALKHRDHYVQILPRMQYLLRPGVGISFGGYLGRYLFSQVKQRDGGGTWIRELYTADRPAWEGGLAAGLELRFGRITGFVRYLHGLTRTDSFFLTDDQGLDLELVRLRNRYLQAGLGYTIFE